MDARYGLKKTLCVWMKRMGDDLPGRSVLNDPSSVHDCDGTSQLSSHADMVADEKDGHAESLLELLQQRQYFLLG